MVSIPQPPNYQWAVLKRIYPWDERELAFITQWLYGYAQKTGFVGSFQDFKLRYGEIIQAQDPQDLRDLIDYYEGPYAITPTVDIDQILSTKEKYLTEDIIVQKYNNRYGGTYNVTPMAFLDQQLKTAECILEENIIIEKIPYAEASNDAGGYTVTIG